jgi:6-methylsalicylic acid synthase
MGLDSVMTQIIRGRLERQFRVSLPATLLWNRPTVQAIGDFLAELLVPEPSQPDEPDEQGPLLPPAVAA